MTILLRETTVIFMFSMIQSIDTATSTTTPLPTDETAPKSFDFRDVVKENSKYSPFNDKCPLRIYGGRAATIDEVPYQVAIRTSNRRGVVWSLLCGGAIVTRRYVVSAAHCFTVKIIKERQYLRVVAGTDESKIELQGLKRKRLQLQDKIEKIEQWRHVVHFYIHAKYTRRITINHDFAVLQLQKDLVFSPTVQPIPMLKNSMDIKLAANIKCLVSGYGLMEYMTNSPTLRMVCVPLVLSTKCRNHYGRRSVTDSQFCAGSAGKDSCQGDSGGPITYKGYLIGLVSYGGKCGAHPGVYTRISSYTTGEKIPFFRSNTVIISTNTWILLTVVLVTFFVEK